MTLLIKIGIDTDLPAFNGTASAQQEIGRIVDQAKSLAVDSWGGTSPEYHRRVQDERGNRVAWISVSTDAHA